MELKSHTIGFKGEYSATVLKADGTVKEFLNEEKTLRSGDTIKNLLLDNFFTRLVSLAEPIGNAITIRCGTGSQPVVESQTGLQSPMTLQSGSWPSSFNAQADLPAVIESGLIKIGRTFTFTFNLGRIVGNISELGVDLANGTSNNLHSRALVVDNQGNPSTISVTSQEQLILTYTLRAEYSVNDVVTNTTFLLNGVVTPVEVTARWNGVNTHNLRQMLFLGFHGNLQAPRVFNGDLNGINEDPSGNFETINSTYSAAYNVSGGKQFTHTLGISTGNLVGGISVIAGAVGNGGKMKFGFNPPIPKNADRTLSITVRQTFGRLP